MSTSNDASQDENTYFTDAENAAEMARLTVQDRLTTKAMEGLFSEQKDLSNIHDILDIGCGPGGWVLDIAHAYPEKRVTGIDISRLMVEYAKAQAREKGLNNASFQVMDALKPLAFAENSFDLVNARFLTAFMPKAGWSKLLQEAMRIVRPGGIIRLTESEWYLTSSPAYERMHGLMVQALYVTGQIFSPDGRNIGITPQLGRLISDAGFRDIHLSSHVIDASVGSEHHLSQYQNTMVFFKLLQPFLIKAGVTTQEELDRLYPQVLEEMMAENYCSISFLLTVWGTKPQ